MVRVKRLGKVIATRYDADTADFLKRQPDLSAFVREAVKAAILRSQTEAANADKDVIIWNDELERLQRELAEVEAKKDEIGGKLTGAQYSPESGENILFGGDIELLGRVYDAYKGRVATLEQRIEELKKKIVES